MASCKPIDSLTAPAQLQAPRTSNTTVPLPCTARVPAELGGIELELTQAEHLKQSFQDDSGTWHSSLVPATVDEHSRCAKMRALCLVWTRALGAATMAL